MRACSQSCPCTDPQNVQSQSLGKPPNRRVSFCEPENKDSVAERRSPLAKPSINDLETWLECQVRQLGTTHGGGNWEPSQALPTCINSLKKSGHHFTYWKSGSSMFPEEGYSVPPAPQSLNRGAFLPDKLAYKDIRQWPALLTIAYCPCLQHWAEKCNLPGNPDFHPLAESVRELRQHL